MTILRRRVFYIMSAAMILLLCGSGCSRHRTNDTKAISINGHQIGVNEFNEFFQESRASMADNVLNRRIVLDNLINRKLLLQEAAREGLDKRKSFLKTIQRFWEQSLLKLVVDNKVAEVSKGITVTDKEVKDYYDKFAKENPEAKPFKEAGPIIRAQILKKNQSEAISAWMESLRKKARIRVDKKALGVIK